MTRFATLFAAAALLASPALAGNYSAKPAIAPVAQRIIGRDIAWLCGPVACRGSTDLSRPVVLCQDLARRAGRIERFAVDGRALGAADLGKCNTAARPAPSLVAGDSAPTALGTAN